MSAAARRFAMAMVAAALLGTPAGAAKGQDLLGDSFEEFTGIPQAAAETLSAEEMDDLRGRFFEVFFSVEFFGHAQADGSLDSTLDVTVNFNDQMTAFSLPGGGTSTGTAANPAGLGGATEATVTNPVTGDVFRLSNVISQNSFSGGGVTGQVIQNNGDGANLHNLSIMNFAVLNVADSEADAVRTNLNRMFGITP